MFMVEYTILILNSIKCCVWITAEWVANEHNKEIPQQCNGQRSDPCRIAFQGTCQFPFLRPLPMLSDVFLFCGRKCRTHFTRGDVLAAWNYTVVHPCHRLPSSFFLDYHLAVLQLHYLTPACNQVKVWRESDRNCGLNGVDDTFVTLTFIVVQVHKSRYLSVAKTSSEIIPTSLAEWPASGIVFSSEIGQALCSSQARKEID